MNEQKRPARWYIVRDKSDGASCLVEASNPAQAFRRAGEHYCTARPATVDEALRLARDGRDVIYAPTGPEQFDLEEQANSVVAEGNVAALAKEVREPEASETSGASGTLNIQCCPLDDDNDGNCAIHSAPGVLRVRAPLTAEEEEEEEELRWLDAKVQAQKAKAPRRSAPRKAGEVFGAGFGPKSAADQID